MQSNPLFSSTLEYCENILGKKIVEPETFRLMRHTHIIICWPTILTPKGGLMCYIYNKSRFGFYQKRQKNQYLREYDKEEAIKAVFGDDKVLTDISETPYKLALDIFGDLEDASEVVISKDKIVGKMIIHDDDDEDEDDEVVDRTFWSLT